MTTDQNNWVGELPDTTEPTEEQKDRARRIVASQAADASEAQLLLTMLGLI